MNINKFVGVCELTDVPKIYNEGKLVLLLCKTTTRRKVVCNLKIICDKLNVENARELGIGDNIYVTGMLVNKKDRDGGYTAENYILSYYLFLLPIKKVAVQGANEIVLCGKLVTPIKTKIRRDFMAYTKIVINEIYDREKGQKCFVNVVFKDECARNAAAWLNKGSEIYVTGELRNFRGKDVETNVYALSNYFKRVFSTNLFKFHRNKNERMQSLDIEEIINLI